MRRIVITLTLMLGAAPLAAQEPQCNTINPNATAACNTAVDAVRAFYPLAGMIVTGGNPVLGTARATGGLGHLTLTARVNGIKAALPDPTAANQSPVPSSFNGVVPAPMVEGAVGLLKGLGGGLLAVDVLGSALVLPTGIKNLTVDSNATHISDAALGIGYGVRVGVLNGGFPIPAVSVSYMHRTVPRLRYGTLGPTFGTGDLFQFTMDLVSDSYRAVAGWKFVLVDVAAGVGVDRYKSNDTNIQFHDGTTLTSVQTVVINPTNTRALAFVNGGLSLAAVKLVGEIGLQSGKDQSYFTKFSDFDPKAAHVFGGLGIRFGF
ncbi:MAG: hypothetical protein E6K55_05910 [Gemmatimonadetes bacterium]|nr:MAG: hypothetical protein DMD67_06670 [Gemmatimonadota bacterium]PYP00317.1 MAG: hypothetical protein DMD61_04590 [Gemmatimonadota bacterium]TLY54359.1 MAG: hypothetical protein E6K55_05910 [Gemmatimonadota bacterium]